MSITTTVPSGDAGTRATLSHMTVLARRAAITPAVRGLAIRMVRGVGPQDSEQQAENIRAWASMHIRFLRDPHGVELLHDPVVMAKVALGGGVLYVDCDDAAMMTAALGLSIGLKARYVAIAFLDKRAPFRHVFTELARPTGSPRWIEQDVTRDGQTQDIPWSTVSRRLVWTV